nr:MAG TPA: hypothetical protein [Caudoviricetes sp.]
MGSPPRPPRQAPAPGRAAGGPPRRAGNRPASLPPLKGQRNER